MADGNKTLTETENPAKAAKQAEVDKANASRSGKGLRLRVGATRGKGSQVISFEVFDESKPDTMPTSVQEFLEILAAANGGKAVSESEMLSYLIEGFNSLSYTNASDPIAEHINSAWPDDLQKAFRGAVRSYVSAAGVSVDDAVAFLKPGIEKAFAAKTVTQ